jgi:hypothetical protein
MHPAHLVRPMHPHPLRRFHPGHKRPIHSPFLSYLEMGGDELGKKKSIFKKIATSAGKARKSVAGAAKVARGTIGFKKGLTPSQLKKAGFARKLLVAAAAITAGTVLLVATGGAAGGVAGKFLMSKGSLLMTAAQKVAAARKKLSDARKAAGLPPITYDRTPEQEVAAAAATIPNASELTPEQVTTQAGDIAAAFAAQQKQVSSQVETPPLQTDPQELEIAQTEAVSTVGPEVAAEIKKGGLSTGAKIAIGVGVVTVIGVGVAIATSGKKRAG